MLQDRIYIFVDSIYNFLRDAFVGHRLKDFRYVFGLEFFGSVAVDLKSGGGVEHTQGVYGSSRVGGDFYDSTDTAASVICSVDNMCPSATGRIIVKDQGFMLE